WTAASPARRSLECIAFRGRASERVERKEASMKDSGRLLWLAVGLILGVLGTGIYFGLSKPVQAASTDRFEDYILCTGAVAVQPRAPTDGVWVLDYRTGKLR